MATSGKRAAGNAIVTTQTAGNKQPMHVHVVDGAGSAVSFGGSGGTSSTDDGAFAVGVDAVTPAGGTYRAVRDAIDSNDAGAIAITAKRAVLTCIETPNADTAMDDVNDAVRVNIVAGSASGTEYTEGDTDSSIAGTAILWEDAADTLRAVSATKPLPVSVIAALPAGTNAIGKLAANSGVDIGDIDVTSIVPGVGATNLGKATDAVAGATDTGVVPLAIRDDSLSSLTPAEGDYAPLRVDANGSLYVTGGGGGTQYTEDAAAAANPVGSALILVREDAHAGSITNADGDNIAARGTNVGELYVKHVDAIPVTDNAGSLTVDGSVTANAGTNLNTSLLALEAGGNLATVAALSKAEDAAHSTGNTGVMALAVRNATVTDLSAGNTDGDYEPLQVSAAGRLWVSSTVDAALPAGANAIGKLAANSGVDIGDVDVTTVGTITPGTAASSLGKAEDAAHSSGDVGVMALTVRQDTAAALGQTDGDYQPPITDASGRLHVNVGNTVTVGSHAVTNAGTFVVQENGAALTSLQLIDDTVIADDAAFTAATTKVVMAGFVADEGSTDSVNEDDAGAARMTLDRKQIVTIQPHTAGGLSVLNATSSDGGTALTNSAQAISAAAGQVYGWYIYNPNATAQFVLLYNVAAASVTVGTTNPLFMLTIPATSAANVNFVQGILFTNAGFSCAAASTAGGNGAPSSALDAVIFYK